jgi:hypothetical protein
MKFSLPLLASSLVLTFASAQAQMQTVAQTVTQTVAPALAQTVDVPAATGNADLTIYNNNFAMVRERRSFKMPGPAVQLVMGGVPRELQPETAFLQVLKGDAVRVTEQIFNFDVLTPSKLLERAVGTEVSVISVNPGNGREVTERARVLSVNEGLVLEINGKVHTNHPGPRGVRQRARRGARPSGAHHVGDRQGRPGRRGRAQLSHRRPVVAPRLCRAI